MPRDLLSAERLRSRVDEIFGSRIRSGAVPGSIVAVFDAEGAGAGEIVHSAGFGLADREDAQSRPTLDTAFRIASCTKSFTAATVLLLRDRGLLQLDAPITDFVPQFRGVLPGRSLAEPLTPTVRMLLSMSGGLPTDDPWGDRQESLPDEAFRALLSRGTPLVSLPGTRFEYSNLGFALLGQVIARVCGAPYVDVVARELLEPLGLTATAFSVAGRESVARGYRRSADGAWHGLPFSGPGAFSPIGGIVTTARDLTRWAGWLASALDPATAQPGPLSASSRRELQQTARTIPPAAGTLSDIARGYGLGLMVEESAAHGRVVSHSGGYPGFSAHMRWSEAGRFGALAFENLTYAGVSAPVTALVDELLEHVAPAAAEPWPETIALAEQANELLDAWDDGLADRILSPNVALDVPYAERRAAIAAALAETGPLGAPRFEAADSPARRSWTRAGDNRTLRAEILVSPTTPALVQTFRIRVIPRE